MHLQRPIVATIAISLAGLAPVSLAATAHAAEPPVLSTVASVKQSYVRPLVHGDKATLVIAVRESSSGSSVFEGSTQLQQSVRGKPWTNVGDATRAGGFVLVENVKVKEKTRFRVLYSGGQGYSSSVSGQSTFSPATSPALTLKVARKITAPKKGFVLKGKVTPDFKKKRLVIKTSKRSTGGFTTWKKVRTTASGTYTVRLPKRSGVRYWKVIVPGDSRYAKNGYTWRTQVF